MSEHVIAVDIGASSGRVIVGTYDNGKLSLREWHRFANQLVNAGEQDCWDVDYLLGEIKTGISKVLEAGLKPVSIGIDTWGVDFVLLDKNGHRLGNAVSYRDKRTEGVMAELMTSPEFCQRIYATTGIQFLPFNTMYQLKSVIDSQPDWLSKVESLLFIPDYLNFKLTGVRHCEYTNASTSQLLDCRSKQWSRELLESLNIPSQWMLEPQAPNQIIGYYPTAVGDIPVASIASHDTASAVLGTPLVNARTAYLCSGTWSLMGVERSEPVISTQAQALNLTNEGGAEGRFRVLKNIMGMWLIQRFQKQHPAYSFADLAEMAAQAVPFVSLVDPDDSRFLNPEDMQQAIDDYCLETGQPVPDSIGAYTRCIFDSLALRYCEVFEQLSVVSGTLLDAIQIVGGGSNNDFLNQLCADLCQVPVWAKPTEASALGNVVGQLIASGTVSDVDQGRACIRRSFERKYYQPNSVPGREQLCCFFAQLRQ
ncbi:rhamnulokinase [Photobacterium satsumensis]|uniref:rhamnulokinase n=1 Tax=Photobacterium satsumensis TaxID=2910239 RepID=UPI003D0EB900